MMDCGLFQGERLWRRRNWEPLSVDAAAVEAVVITHAHLDHSGYLPLLVRNGFRGQAYCTPQTAELAAIILRDSAHIAERDAQLAEALGYSKHEPALPLYDSTDAERAIELLTPVDHDTPTTIAGGIGCGCARPVTSSAPPTPSSRSRGPGSSSAATSDGPGHPLLLPPEPPPTPTRWSWSRRTATGCTTAGRRRAGRAIIRTVGRGGVVADAGLRGGPHRVLLDDVGAAGERGRIPTVPVYVDSPMALRALEVYRGDPGPRPASCVPRSPWRARQSTPATSSWPAHRGVGGAEPAAQAVHHRLRLRDGDRRPGAAPSGAPAAAAPQQRDHHRLPGAGTRGRMLADGEKQVKIHGRYIPVRAEVREQRLLRARRRRPDGAVALRHGAARTAYVVHGEQDASRALAARLAAELGWNAVVPRYLERVRL